VKRIRLLIFIFYTWVFWLLRRDDAEVFLLYVPSHPVCLKFFGFCQSPRGAYSSLLASLHSTPVGVLKFFVFFILYTYKSVLKFLGFFIPILKFYCFLSIYKQKKYQEWTIDVCVLLKWLIISVFCVFFLLFWLCFRVHNMNIRSVAEHLNMNTRKGFCCPRCCGNGHRAEGE